MRCLAQCQRLSGVNGIAIPVDDWHFSLELAIVARFSIENMKIDDRWISCGMVPVAHCAGTRSGMTGIR